MKKVKSTKVTVKYKDKEYVFEHHWHPYYSEESANFMFTEGNYSCDCTLSLFIKEHCDKNFEDLPCGEEIEIIKLENF